MAGPTITHTFGEKLHTGQENFLECECGWKETVLGTHTPHQIATIHLLEEHEGKGGVSKTRDEP